MKVVNPVGLLGDKEGGNEGLLVDRADAAVPDSEEKQDCSSGSFLNVIERLRHMLLPTCNQS